MYTYDDEKDIFEFDEMEFYHVVTDRPMYAGQHIIFDANHHSGVYTRVMERKALADDIYANPKKYKEEELEHHTKVALRELALEEIRRSKYPGYPSRMSCLYVSKTLEEAEKWFDFFTEIGRPTYQIVRINVKGSYFAGNANNCFDGVTDKSRNLELAEKYWENANVNEEDAVIEILVDGDIEVIEIVKNIED